MAAEAPVQQGFARLRRLRAHRHVREVPERHTQARLRMHYFEPSAKQWERDIRELRNRLLSAMGLIVFVTLVGIVGFLTIRTPVSSGRSS